MDKDLRGRAFHRECYYDFPSHPHGGMERIQTKA